MSTTTEQTSTKLTFRRYRDGDPLIREVLDRGKVLYELPVTSKIYF